MSEILLSDPRAERTLDAAEVAAELDALARRYRDAGGFGIQILNLLAGSADGLIDRLPRPVQSGLEGATRQALRLAMFGANGSRRMVPDLPAGINRAVSAAMGAAGGMGGLPGALVELPATTAFLLRSIQGVAADEGFDATADSVKFDCIQVFSAAGPLAADDGADLGFLSLRLGLTGAAVQKLIAQVAPRLSVVLGQKLAAQTVPVLGAVAGATTNFVYSGYYQEMARVHFGLRRLAVAADQPHEDLLEGLRDRLLDPA
ncbi:MAG: EcsC family protein [Pseudomonadota bacterium]|nr:EcsC family protein [Pseudomonadota bacterium]